MFFNPVKSVFAAFFLMLFSLAALAQTTINVSGAASGPEFYGIGAMSAGGGNSRLLYDYPVAEQSQILDYLFKPGVGANLQVLKVEIGGGADSTDGSESSIEPAQGVINCNTGYEWWLMAQAKARNPDIKFYALTWTSPGWIGGWWNTNAINYLVDYLTCAQSHGLTISYLGGFNETHGYGTAAWWEALRSALNAHGFSSVQLIGGDLIDGFSGIANALNGDSQWASVMNFIGAHYPCGDWPPRPGGATTCVPSGLAAAVKTGKPMWQSEGGALDYAQGAGYVTRSIVRGYVDAGMVEYNNWPIVAALYPNLVYPTSGLIWANQPWSGWYSVGATTAVLAHVAQFAQPGWTFINGGYLQATESNGTYMTLKSTVGTDYSTIIETTTASVSQSVTLKISGGLSSGKVYVWATNLGSSSQSDWMVQQPSVVPVNGSFSLTLQPNYLYSITTTTGQGFGTVTSPASAVMSLPYADTFGDYATGSSAKYVAQIQGDFQSQPCVGTPGNCLTQMVPAAPSIWFYGDVGTPWAVLGDVNWSNYTVSVNALMEQAGSVYLAGRVGAGKGSFSTGTNSGTAPAGWEKGVSSATVAAATLVDMGPQPLTGGSWQWTSSNGFTSTSREIHNIAITTSSIYLAVYTDSSGCQSSQYFTFTVASTPAPTAPKVPTPPCKSATAVTPYINIVGSTHPDGFDGYSLQVSNTGAWSLLSNAAAGFPTELAAGTLATAPGLNTWVALSMTFNGSTISGSINGSKVASVSDSSYARGQVGFGVLGWQTDQFSNLTLQNLPPVTLGLSPSALSLAAGASGTSTLTVTPADGFTGSVAVACSSPVIYVTCTATSPVTISGAAAVTSTITVNVAASAELHAARAGPDRGTDGTSPLYLACLLPIAARRLPLPFRRRASASRIIRLLALSLAALGVAIASSGCGGGGSNSSALQLVPSGQQIVTITATANSTAVTTTLNVDVTN